MQILEVEYFEINSWSADSLVHLYFSLVYAKFKMSMLRIAAEAGLQGGLPTFFYICSETGQWAYP